MPSKSLQATGTDALQKAPQPLQRVLHGLGVQFRGETGPTQDAASTENGAAPEARNTTNANNFSTIPFTSGNSIAGVIPGSSNVSVMNEPEFNKNANQIAPHEGMHVWQNNLPPALQAKIPQDNPSDPYNFGGLNALQAKRKQGYTMLSFPREQQAAMVQYRQAQGGDKAPPMVRQAIDPYLGDMNSIPLSQIDMTDPNAKEINTHPRAPLPPIMNYATDTYKKGEPAPGDDPYAAFVQTGTVGGHAPDDSPVGVAQGVSNPSAAPAETDPYASYAGAPQNPDEPYDMQLLKSIPTALKSAGKGILEGAGGTLNNLRQLGLGPKGTPEEEQQLKSLITPSGDENDVAAQKFGRGVEQAGEFLIPGMGEEAAVSKLGKLAPLGKLAYNALTTGAMNKAQGGDFSTGAIAGGLGSVGGQLLEHAAPAVAEQALGIRGRVDRAFNKEPGRAVLDEIKGVRPDTIAENTRTRINELSGQVEQAADAASTRPNAVRGLLQAPPEAIPLHSAPDIEGTLSRPIVLNQADRPGLPMLPSPTHTLPSSSHADIFPDQLPQGATNIPTGGGGDAPGMSQGQYIGQIPGDRGGPGQTQGVFMRRPTGEGAPIPRYLPNRIASLAPARGVVDEAMGGAARQNAEGAFGQLEGMGNFLNRNFLSGEAIPSNVTPRQLLDLRRGFNEEFGQWNPERKDATITTGRRAYSALSNELHNTLPDIAPLDARISNLIPVKNRAQVKALGDDNTARVLSRIARPTGALAGLGTGAYVGGKEGGTAGAIEGGLLGLVLPELMSSPTGQMVTARTLNRAGALRPLVGAGLQLDRRPQQ